MSYFSEFSLTLGVIRKLNVVPGSSSMGIGFRAFWELKTVISESKVSGCRKSLLLTFDREARKPTSPQARVRDMWQVDYAPQLQRTRDLESRKHTRLLGTGLSIYELKFLTADGNCSRKSPCLKLRSSVFCISSCSPSKI